MYRFVIVPLVGAVLSLAMAQTIYVFDGSQLTGPDTIAATGYHEIALHNQSDAGYDLSLTRLRAGWTADDYRAALDTVTQAFQTGGDIGSAIAAFQQIGDQVGGVHTGPGQAGTAGLLLEPGAYVLDGSCSECPPGQQMLSLTVLDGPRAEPPPPDLVVEMKDYQFTGIPSELPAGEQLWDIANTGAEGHVLILFRLAQGATMDDLASWMSNPENMGGAPPAELGEDAASSSYLTAGARYFATFDLQPGTYAVVCPVPDRTGTPHHAHGMIQLLFVQ